MATPLVTDPITDGPVRNRDRLPVRTRMFLSSITALAYLRNRIPWARVQIALAFLFIIIGGVCRSIEAGCQNSLKLSLQNVWLCSVISYAVAFAGVSAALLVSLVIVGRRPWPTKADLKALPLWSPFGGLVGGATIFAMIAFASDVGVSAFNALLIAGQMLFAVVLDHFGWMNFPRRRINPQRLAACVMIVIGAYVMAKY